MASNQSTLFPNWQLRPEDDLAPSVAALFYEFDPPLIA